jgi:thiol-disulfide isomerase/thioredoxin
MFKKTIAIATLLLISNLNAYEKGDTVSPEILKTLNIDNSKITVVDFFASWCVSCKHELPLINKVHNDMNTTKYEIIGVDTDKKIEKGKAFQEELGLKFRVFNDEKQEIIKAFAPLGMPSLYLIKDGKVIDLHMGAIDNVDKVLEDRLAEEK